MNLKPLPNHRMHIEALRRMTPEQRLKKAFELTELTRRLFLHGLRKRFPDMPEDELRRLAAKRIRACSNRNY
jgi:hypothetical protein